MQTIGEWAPWVVTMGEQAGKAALRMLLVVLLGMIALRFLRVAFNRFEAFIVRMGQRQGADLDARRQWAATLTGILRTVAMAALGGLIVVEVLEQAGFDIRPILAGAGILGLAIGFGAQNLVRDLISGFFLVLEDQVRLGDSVTINGVEGLVESVTFRVVMLRDVAGAVHFFPNGAITSLANRTRGWCAVVFDAEVGAEEDPDRAMAVMRSVGDALQADPAFAPKILAPIEVMGLQRFAESSMVLRIRLRTRPADLVAVGVEYRRRLKAAFDAHGIEMPYPHRTIVLKDERGPAHGAALPSGPPRERQTS